MIDVLKHALRITRCDAHSRRSGGTTAIILGIYDRLVASIGSFFKDIKHNLLFLASVAAGGVLGLVLFAKPLLSLVNLWEAPMLCLFMGATSGSLPMLIRKSKSGFNLSTVLFALAGFGLVLCISLLPEGLFSFEIRSVPGFFILLAAGIPLAVALVLPGISISYMMLVIGIWEPVAVAISSLDILFLAPLAIGLGLGVILTTRLLERAMNRFPGQTYFAIIGFVLGSILEIIRKMPKPGEFYVYPICVLTFAIGMVAIWYYTSKIE